QTTLYPPPEYPGDPNASYGKQQLWPADDSHPQPFPNLGGWDREEVYTDPWTGRVYIGMSGNGGIPDDNAAGAKYQDTLLFRSGDGGATWTSLPITGLSTPVMMTSIPSRLFLFTCSGGAPLLWWSDDGGAKVKGGIRLSSSLPCMSGQWGNDGSPGI